MVELDPRIVEGIREELSAGALMALDRVRAARYFGAVVDTDGEDHLVVRLLGDHPHREVASRVTVPRDVVEGSPDPSEFVWLELEAARHPEAYRVVADDALTEAMTRYYVERRRRARRHTSSPSILTNTAFESAG